jgi:hypothetical protein
MPFEAIDRPEHALVITVPRGRITNEELQAYYRARLEGEPPPRERELVDGRWMDAFDVDAAGQEELVALLAENRDRLAITRWGFIADSMVAFGMFRMFEAQKQDLPFETSVFRTPGAAAEWLTVPVDTLLIDPPV